MVKNRYLAAILFLITILFFASGKDIPFFLIGIGIWWLAIKNRLYSEGYIFFAFYLGLHFLYPHAFSKGSNFHDHDFVFGLFSICFYLFNFQKIQLELKENPIVKKIVVFWIIWSVFSYAPVIVSSLGLESFPFNIIYSKDLAVQSTLLKTTVVQVTVILILLPILSLRNYNDFNAFFNIVCILTAILVFAGFIQYYTRIRFIPENYSGSLIGNRFFTFSMPDANGYARLLILPVMLFISYLLSRKVISGRIILLTMLSICSVILTYSRTAFASISVGLISIMLLFSVDRKTIKPIVICFIFIGMFWFGTGLFKSSYENNLERLRSKANLEGRLILQQRALEIIRANPFFGAHPGHYWDKMREGLKRDINLASAHNIYLQIGVEWGSPLSLVLILCLFLSLKYAMKVRKILKKKEAFSYNEFYISNTNVYFIIGTTVAYIVHSVFEIVSPYFIFLQLGLSIAIFKLVSTQVRLSRIPSEM